MIVHISTFPLLTKISSSFAFDDAFVKENVKIFITLIKESGGGVKWQLTF